MKTSLRRGDCPRITGGAVDSGLSPDMKTINPKNVERDD